MLVKESREFKDGWLVRTRRRRHEIKTGGNDEKISNRVVLGCMGTEFIILLSAGHAIVILLERCFIVLPTDYIAFPLHS